MHVVSLSLVFTCSIVYSWIYNLAVGELKKDVVGANYPMPDHLSDDLQRTIRKCLTLDRRRRLGVRQVLEDDAWLSNHGALPSPFDQIDAAVVEDTTRVRVDRERLRRQYLRDMEERGRSGMLPTIRKTVMYHPINASIYFTGAMQHSPSLEESLRTKELMRADLYKEIRVIINQVRLRPVANASMKPPLVQHFLQKFKRGNNSSTPVLSTKQTIRRSTSALHFSHLYKKAAKDQVNYYTIECNVRAVSSTTAVSSNASNDVPTPSIPIPPQPHYSTPHQDEYELILLVRSACELLGITYRHESKTRLLCVLTLRNYREDPGQLKEKHHHHQQQHQQARRASSQMTSGGTSEHTSSVLSDNSWASKLKRLSLPLLSNHFHNHNQQQARIWSNSIQINSSATPASVASGQQHAEPSSSSTQPMTTSSSEDGTAMFAIEAFAIQSTKQQQQQQRVVALRYSCVNGSTKVYKLATGWVGGVLSSTKTVGA